MQKYEKKKFPPRKVQEILRKEEITDEYRRYHACNVGTKPAGDGIAITTNSHAAKVHRKDVKSCVGATLQHTCQMSYERIRTIIGKAIEHHATRRRSA